MRTPNFIKKIWSNKFEILNFIFTWLLPLAFVATKVKYIEVHIAWKITIYGILALAVLFIGLRKQLKDVLLRKTGYKSVRDYFIKRKYGFVRWLGLGTIKHFKQGIMLLVFWLMSRLTENLIDNWLLIMSLTAIGTMFSLIHNLAKRERIEEELEGEEIS